MANFAPRILPTLFLASAVLAQILVKDVNPTIGNASSDPTSITVLGGNAFFVADDGVHGPELWKTDGTTAGTVMVLDINPAPAAGSGAGGLTVFGSELVFFATDGTHGLELWRSDGTAAGTVLAVDIAPGSASSSPSSLTVLGTHVYFAASTVNAGRELWRFDGVSASLVADINPGVADSSPGSIVVAGGILYLVATTAASGTELHRSDGSAAGTWLVADLAGGSTSSYPRYLQPFGNKVLFTAVVPATGREAYVSDGSYTGTVLLLDGSPGAASALPSPFVVNGPRAFFSVNSGTGPSATGRELYSTDGTVAGTGMVLDLCPGSGSGVPTESASSMTVFGAGVMFLGDDGNTGAELFVTDGTAAGTRLVLDIYPGGDGSGPDSLANLAGTVYLRAGAPGLGYELWKSDGTASGTVLVKDLFPGVPSGSPAQFELLGTTVLFTGTDGQTLTELWKTDGTSAGTQLVKDINTTRSVPASGLSGGNLARLGDRVFFAGDGGPTGTELWVSDGTTAGTRLFLDIHPFGESSPSFLMVHEGRLYFSARDAIHGVEPWVSDGTLAGTRMLLDCAPGRADSSPMAFVGSGHLLFFVAVDDTSPSATGRELYVTDGTPQGTRLVLDLNPGVRSGVPSATAGSLIPEAAGVVFGGDDGATGPELFYSDGTAAGTRLILDINPGAQGSYAEGLTRLGDRLLFRARQPATGAELWSTDGSPAGTVLVKDIWPGTASSLPASLFAWGGIVLFSASDPNTGAELWSTDGTAANTLLVTEIWPGVGSSSPDGFVNAGGTVFFLATDGTPATGTGRELYTTNGSAAGTVLVRDLASGSASGCLTFPFALGSGKRVALSATDGVAGNELWVSDGSATGTTMIADLRPGGTGSAPASFVLLGNDLLFAADDGTHGRELWAGPLALLGASLAESFGSGCAGTGGKVPRTIATSAPFLGNPAFGVAVADALPMTTCVLLLHETRNDLVLGSCTVYPALPAVTITGTSDGSGRLTVNLPIALRPWWLGVNLYFQWGVVDPAGAWLGLASFSDGLRVLIGRS